MADSVVAKMELLEGQPWGHMCWEILCHIAFLILIRSISKAIKKLLIWKICGFLIDEDTTINGTGNLTIELWQKPVFYEKFKSYLKQVESGDP